jgi:hypothetical protein
MCDRPLSAAYWKIDDMIGEEFLDELPELQIKMEEVFNRSN